MSSIIRATTTSGLQIAPDNSGSLQLQTNGTTAAVTIDTSQNVGIGNTAPNTRLHVQGGTNADGSLTYNQQLTSAAAYNASPATGTLVSLQYNSGGSYAGMGGWSVNKENATDGNFASYFALHTRPNGGSTTERMRIDSSGNVGIGTASPTESLTIDSTATYKLSLKRTADGSYAALGATGNNFLFYNAGAERMRIDSSGNLMVGKTNASAGNNGFLLTNAGQSFNTIDGGANTLHVFSSSAGAYRFYVSGGGTISATNTTITSLSDQRFKENIKDLEDGLDSVMALKPRQFDWKEGKGKDIKGDRGFIAQEFETVFPDMIEEWLDPAPKNEEPYKAINANLIPILVKAIQEQQTIINDLKARIETLEAK